MIAASSAWPEALLAAGKWTVLVRVRFLRICCTPGRQDWHQFRSFFPRHATREQIDDGAGFGQAPEAISTLSSGGAAPPSATSDGLSRVKRATAAASQSLRAMPSDCAARKSIRAGPSFSMLSKVMPSSTSVGVDAPTVPGRRARRPRIHRPEMRRHQQRTTEQKCATDQPDCYPNRFIQYRTHQEFNTEPNSKRERKLASSLMDGQDNIILTDLTYCIWSRFS
jgi:hypothetical protein